MKLESTIYSNYRLVIDELGIPVAVQVNGKFCRRLYDVVSVKRDFSGYIGKGIKHEGIGTIVQIRHDKSGNFFGVLMNNGEFGYVRDARLTKI